MLKPSNKNRDAAFNRYQKKKFIKRRKNIVRFVYLEDPEENRAFCQSRLAKGKLHCSCPLCAQKTNKRKANHSGWRMMDRRNLDKIDSEIKEFNTEDLEHGAL